MPDPMLRREPLAPPPPLPPQTMPPRPMPRLPSTPAEHVRSGLAYLRRRYERRRRGMFSSGHEEHLARVRRMGEAGRRPGTRAEVDAALERVARRIERDR